MTRKRPALHRASARPLSPLHPLTRPRHAAPSVPDNTDRSIHHRWPLRHSPPLPSSLSPLPLHNYIACAHSEPASAPAAHSRDGLPLGAFSPVCVACVLPFHQGHGRVQIGSCRCRSALLALLAMHISSPIFPHASRAATANPPSILHRPASPPVFPAAVALRCHARAPQPSWQAAAKRIRIRIGRHRPAVPLSMPFPANSPPPHAVLPAASTSPTSTDS